MPTYFANGITATLAVCDLEPSLSASINLRMGKDVQEDSSRINQVLERSTELTERIIELEVDEGENQTERSTMHFVGRQKDIPLFVVEAGKDLAIDQADTRVSAEVYLHRIAAAAEPAYGMTQTPGSRSMTESPLSSLGATPLVSTPRSKLEEDVFLSTPRDPISDTETTPYPTPSLPILSDEPVTTCTTPILRPEALLLKIEIDQKFYRAFHAHDPSKSTDLKVEVFINGHLAEVKFISTRNFTPKGNPMSLRFSGTRIHRQCEKAWVYASSRDLPIHSCDATARWHSIAAALSGVGRARGKTGSGDSSPSAELLAALSKMKIPKCISEHKSFGIVDIIITAGRGTKYGPETQYLVAPTPMADPRLVGRENSLHPTLSDENMELSPTWISDSLRFSTPTPTAKTSPEAPSKRRRQISAALSVPTTEPQGISDLTEKLGFYEDRLGTILESYKNAHGKLCKTPRTLRQRLGDVKKMSPAKRARELEKFNDEMNHIEQNPKEQVITKPTAHQNRLNETVSKPVNAATFSRSPTIPSRTSSCEDNSLGLLNHVYRKDSAFVPTNGHLDSLDTNDELTKKRTETALNAGALSHGPLMKRIASLNPQKAPAESTEASPLQNSPVHVPVKPQQRRVSLTNVVPKTPGRNLKRRFTETESPHSASTLANDGVHTPSRKPTRASGDIEPRTTRRSGYRTSQSRHPGKPNMTDALRDFKMADTCRGSCVSYLEQEGTERQISKARGGEFEEDEIVVGMRFIVT